MSKLVREIVRKYLDSNPEWKKEDLDTVCLYGDGGIFDSLDLVRFIVHLEIELTKSMYTNVSLRTDKAFSHRRNPFVSITSLENFVEEAVNEHSDNRK